MNTESTWLAKNGDALLEATTFFIILSTTTIAVFLYFDLNVVPAHILHLLIFLLVIAIVFLLARQRFVQRVMRETLPEVVSQAAELQSQQQNDLFQQVYHNSPVPYVLIDQSGGIISANVAAVRLFRASKDTINGLLVFSYIKTSHEAHIDFIQEKFRSGVALANEEVQIVFANDPTASVWALLSLFPFVDTAGQSVGLLTLVDITRQKQIENAKAEFVSLASHQLRTPIAGMRWSAELLLLDNPQALSHRQQKYVARMLESVDRMSLLVDDFLRVSRFELGTFVPETAVVSIPGLVREIQTDQAAAIRRKELNFVTDLDPQAEATLTDPNLLRMIVTNLLSNAIKYTVPKGDITVSVRVEGGECTLTVQDSGMGIPDADQPQIFQKLFRASNATREVPDGTGLGLYIVREAVRVLKGRISFTSTEGIGTTFTVVVPYEAAATSEVVA